MYRKQRPPLHNTKHISCWPCDFDSEVKEKNLGHCTNTEIDGYSLQYLPWYYHRQWRLALKKKKKKAIRFCVLQQKKKRGLYCRLHHLFMPTAIEERQHPDSERMCSHIHKQIFIQTHAHKRHTGRSVWLHPNPFSSDTALRMYDCDFHIMCVTSQTGRFSNCPIMIHLPIQYHRRRDSRQA